MHTKTSDCRCGVPAAVYSFSLLVGISSFSFMAKAVQGIEKDVHFNQKNRTTNSHKVKRPSGDPKTVVSRRFPKKRRPAKRLIKKKVEQKTKHSGTLDSSGDAALQEDSQTKMIWSDENSAEDTDHEEQESLDEDPVVTYRNLEKHNVSSDSENDADQKHEGSEYETSNHSSDDGDEEADVRFTGDLSVVKERIAINVRKLANWKVEEKKTNRIPRSTVVNQLTKDAALYYGFGEELVDYFVKLFNPVECIAFFEAVDVQRPLTLRTNMLYTRRRDLARTLIARGCNVDPVGDWTKVGLKVMDSSVPVGATPEYCAGHYMIQAASSFVPVMALAPMPGELVLDMAAAPGGKSTYIGQLMKNSGVLFCNEYNKDRTASLVGNIHRMGITNAIVLNMDGALLPGKLPPMDRVLLDAPCSGLGVISRDPSIKTKRTLKDFQEHATVQKKLLAAAVDACNASSTTGGYIVYSTCSLSIEENEEVIDYIIRTRYVKVVPLGFSDDLWCTGLSSYRDKRFHPSLKLARRIYPHVHNMDGFFVCKLKKIRNGAPKRERKDRRKSNVFVKTWGDEQWKSELLDSTLDVPMESSCAT